MRIIEGGELHYDRKMGSFVGEVTIMQNGSNKGYMITLVVKAFKNKATGETFLKVVKAKSFGIEGVVEDENQKPKNNI